MRTDAPIRMRRFSAATVIAAALLLTGGPAAADGPPEVITGHDQFVGPNPCTGERHTLTFDITVAVHAFENKSGRRHHENSQFSIDVTTDDGFTGSSVGPFIDNGSGPVDEEEGTGMLQIVFNLDAANDTGQRIKVHGAVHFTQVDHEVTAFVDHFSLRCVGRPA